MGAANSVAGERGSTVFVKKKLVYKFLRGFKKVGAPRVMSTAASTRLASLGGEQFPFSIALFTLPGGTSTSSLFGFDHLDALYDQLRVDNAATTPAIGVLAQRLYLSDCDFEARLRNSSTGQLRVSIYDLVCRRDRGGQTEAHNDFANGLLDTLDPASTFPLIPQTSPGASPFQSQRLTQNWKVQKVTKFVLSAGSEHVHRGKFVWNRMLNYANLNSQRMYARMTFQCMVIIEGAVAQTAGPLNEVGLAPGQLDCFTTTRTRFYALEKSRTIFSTFDNTTSAATNQVVEDTDEVGVVTFA